MEGDELNIIHSLASQLRKTGAVPIANSEEILSWGCDAVSEPISGAPSTVFLRGALAHHSKQHNNQQTIEQMAYESPQFGERITNLDNRNDLGGVLSERYEEFEQN